MRMNSTVFVDVLYSVLDHNVTAVRKAELNRVWIEHNLLNLMSNEEF